MDNHKNVAFAKARRLNLLKNGYKELKTIDELKEEPKGLITYIDVEGNYYKGGFLKRITDDNIIITDMNKTHKVPIENLKRFYVRSPLRLLNRKPLKTNFRVKIGGVTIYYARDNLDKTRFKQTLRYKKLKDWYEKYGIKE